jgi:hypothetical protein
MMLTKEKIEIFKSYRGNSDWFQIQNKNKDRIITDEDWSVLYNLVQDIFLVRTAVAAKCFETKIMQRLYESCDDESTCDLVLELEKYMYGVNRDNNVGGSSWRFGK